MTSLSGAFPSVPEICAHIKHLPEANGIAIHVRTKKDLRIRILRIPVTLRVQKAGDSTSASPGKRLCFCTEIGWRERAQMFLQEFFASIRARLRRSTWHRDEDGVEIATRLQELLGKPVESETLSTNAPSRNDPSHPYRHKTGT